MKHTYFLLIGLVSLSMAHSAVAGFEPIRISRNGWNARSARTNELSMDNQSKSRFIIGHHGVTSRYRDINGDKALARSIQDTHMGQNRWADIGYHFMVGKNGTILEGRDPFAAPACVQGYNSGSICAIFLGCYDDYSCNPVNLVTSDMIFAMGKAIGEMAYRLSMYDIGRDSVFGMNELSGAYPHSPGNRIMQPNATGFVQIDVIATLARKELARLRTGHDDL